MIGNSQVTDFLLAQLGCVTGLPSIFASGNVLLTLCECNCTQFPGGKSGVIARSDSVQAMREITLVGGDIQRVGFEVRELGPIARFLARPAIGKVALMHADGDALGFRIGETVAVAGY